MRLRLFSILPLILLATACAAIQPTTPSLTVSVASSNLIPSTTLYKSYDADVFVDAYGAIGANPLPTAASWVTPKLPDSGSAIQAAIDAIPPGGTLRFAFCRYYSASTLFVKRDIRIIHLGGSRISTAACGIIFPAGIIGLILDAPTTIEGLTLMANTRVVGAGVANIAAHGIIMHRTSYLTGVYVRGFEGHGILIDSATSNANSFRITGGSLSYNGLNGLYIRGADSNAGIIDGVSSTNNGLCGFHESSFLGNTYLGTHTDANKNGCSYESGFEIVVGVRKDIRTNHSLFLNVYEEDKTVADLGYGSIWVGGQGQSIVKGLGSVLQVDGDGFRSDHFTAWPLSGGVVARLGSLASGAYVGEAFVAGAKGPIYTMSSPTRPGWLDTMSSPTSNQVAFRVSTSSAAEGAGLFEAPNGVRLGGVTATRMISGANAPTTGTWRLGDVVFNAKPALATAPWGWQCVVPGMPGKWRSLTVGQ